MLLRDSLRSRVGQQLFLRFMVVALLPIIGLTGYAYIKVSQLLVDSAHQEIQQSSKALGMAVIDRLNLQAKTLTRLAAAPDPSSVASSSGLLTHIGLAGPDLLKTLDRDAATRLKGGDLVMQFGTGPRPPLTLLVRRRSDQQIIAAQINTDLLWHNEMAPENFCVLTHTLRVLYCSPRLRAANLGADGNTMLGPSNTGTFDFSLGKRHYLAGFWNVSLRASFANPGMIFMTTEKRADVMGALNGFKIFFGAIALLALGIAAFLAVRQIRQQLRPLNLLMGGTRRLAEGDFSTQIEVQGNDEFGQLAGAFNRMAGNLSDKFHLLQALARLDQTILDAPLMDDVIRALLDVLPGAVHADTAAVVYCDDRQHCVLYTTERMTVVPREMTAPLQGLLARMKPAPWTRIGPGSPLHGWLRKAEVQTARHTLAFPAFHNKRCVGALILGFKSSPEPLEDVTHAARSLADRLSVATAKLAAEEALHHQAHHDALTDLPNRTLLRDRAEQAMERSDRYKTVTALLLADLDKFKQVNDSLGHAAGDKLLEMCAHRLQQNVRRTDTVARFGGDEFLILLPDLAPATATSTIIRLIQKLNQVLTEPVAIQNLQVTTAVSIGVALYPENAQHFEDLLKMADAAMYEAKREPGTVFKFFSHSMNTEVRERFELTQKLRSAIENSELTLYYQPRVDLRTRQIQGAEALARWISPQRGIVEPEVFIPQLDEMGLGNKLGDWVLEQACSQMAEWDRQGIPAVPLSINLSPNQFLERNLYRKVQDCLEHHGLRPNRLEIEMLEATAINDSEVVRENLLGLRALGINVSLDDFGTGYSSLIYLSKVAANMLKLDRAFIADLATSTRQQSIVRQIIALAKALKFTVVAEGIEDEAQLKVLQEMGCDMFQGFLYSHPLPADQFADLLRTEEMLAAGSA